MAPESDWQGSGIRSDWEDIRQLGSGGQSEVILVRGRVRTKARASGLTRILQFNPWGPGKIEIARTAARTFAEAVSDYCREDRPSELGAMKVFKLRGSGAAAEKQAAERLKQEVEVLKRGYDGLPKVLDYNLRKGWMVTEYFPEGSLESNLGRYKGNAALSIKAFLSLAKTVAELHADGIVHRDIKPANVFARKDDQLVLGDFGIVFLPNQPNRPTLTGESVGPHDYMPPWAEAGGRSAKVGKSFDIYMLGKLLWCMVSGRLRLQREYFNLPENDLTALFKDNPAMHAVNRILKKCVVEREADCKTSASDLVAMASGFARMFERGGQLLHADVPRPCRVCGRGYYRNAGFPPTQPPIPKGEPVNLRVTIGGSDHSALPVLPYVCDQCGHVEFFTRSAAPEN